MYFIQNPPRLRKFKIGGIYETGLEEYDKMYVLVDIAHIQKLNNWNKSQISGFEILIDDYDKLNEVTDSVKEKIGFQFFDNGSTLKVRNVVQNNPQIFDWLDLTDTNVWVILILMVIVASFNMISGLLVLILDRTNMIGILKALGMENFRIRKIFMFQSINIIVKGIFWGNISGLSICLIQFFGEVIKLDPSSYYVNNVPVNISLLHFFLLNIGVFLIIAGILIVPSVLIKYITPVKAIRFN
jgi:lipoprotein-releasing system permease protein